MQAKAIRLGKIFNIPVQLDYSWFLIFALMTWLLAGSYFPAEYPGWPLAEYWLLGAVTALMLFASVLLHELGHSLVAVRNGIPVRSITLFLFGGVAQIEEEPVRPRVDFLVASAGLAVSLLLAGVFGVLQVLAAGIAPLLALTRYLMYINLSLFIFNLIPGFPLDGGRVFRAIVWGVLHDFERATRIAAGLGRVVAFLFMLFGAGLIFFGSFLNGLWIIFIGWFLENASSGEVRQQNVRALLAGRKVSQIMSRDYPSVPADLSLQQLADEHILGAGKRFFIVEKNGEVAGIMTLRRICAIPREKWTQTRVSEAMVPGEKMQSVAPDTELWDALQNMDRKGVNQLPVMAGGRIQGVLTRENLVDYLQTILRLR